MSPYLPTTSHSPIIRKLGNAQNLHLVQDADVSLLSDDSSPGWWSSITYPAEASCNSTMAGLVTGFRTNVCIASPTESFFVFCNSENVTMIIYPNTECNHRKGTPSYLAETLKCYNNIDPDAPTDANSIYAVQSYSGYCENTDFPSSLPKVFAANRYYTDSECKNMISYNGYANDFCIVDSYQESYIVNYPALTVYNSTHNCKKTTTPSYGIFNPMSCAKNPYTSSSQYISNSEYYDSGFMIEEVSNSFATKAAAIWGPGSIAAIALGAFIAIVAVLVGVYFYYVRNKKNNFPSAYDKAEVDALNYPEFGGEVQEFQFSATY